MDISKLSGKPHEMLTEGGKRKPAVGYLPILVGEVILLIIRPMKNRISSKQMSNLALLLTSPNITFQVHGSTKYLLI